MLNTAIYIWGAASAAPNYTASIYFDSASEAGYLNIGDYIKDTAGNEYEVIALDADPFVSAGTITVSHITTDVVPVDDSGYNSIVYTPGQVAYNTELRSSGNILAAAAYDPPEYEYLANLQWDDTGVANDILVGDRVVDPSGKEYELTFIDETEGFAVSARVKEIHKTGQAPISGPSTLYRPTVNYGFYQGKGLDINAYSTIAERDSMVLDEVLAGVVAGNTSPAGGTTGQVLTKDSDVDHDVSWTTASGGSGGSDIYISDEPPVDTVTYKTWLNSINGITHTFYDDGDSEQWIEDGTGGEVGKAGPTVISADTDNAASLGTDGYIFVDTGLNDPDIVFDGGTSTSVTVKSDDNGISTIDLLGDSQGTGRVYLGQGTDTGGGIEYSGDSSPLTTGAGNNYLALYRKDGGILSWTARNRYNSPDWEFRGSVAQNSDRRLKDNIEVIPDALNKIKQIEGVTYTRNDTDSTLRHTGVIAQDVQVVLPEAVIENNEAMLSVSYGNMVGLLIEGIKQQSLMIEELEKRIENLGG